jgi:integrase
MKMGQIITKRFKIVVQQENSYFRIHITHPDFTGRVRKRLGVKSQDDADNTALNIRFELGRHFEKHEVTKEAVEDFVENYISLNVKKTASIFDYKEEFIESKKKANNKYTKNSLSPSTISGYRTALQYFEEYFINNRIPQHPSYITDETLNGFYRSVEGSHNYRVKLHNKVKGYIKYLILVKNLPIDQRYKLSAFNEEYDNQDPKDNDIAIPEADIKKLIALKRKLSNGEINVKSKKFSDKIPRELQMKNADRLEANLIKSLDCFLFMIATGMYWADVMKSELLFSNQGNVLHLRYRRAKNGSLCKAIPIQDNGIFIAGEIIKQYQIKNKSNFPLNLSLTHFDKHLQRISKLAGLDYGITNKMARKTFASTLYFNRMLPIHYLQILLGHKDVRDTTHYLRISDNDIAKEIYNWISEHNHTS